MLGENVGEIDYQITAQIVSPDVVVPHGNHDLRGERPVRLKHAPVTQVCEALKGTHDLKIRDKSERWLTKVVGNLVTRNR